MHFGRTCPWFSRHDAAMSSRAPSVERVESKACRPLRVERENFRQVAGKNHYAGRSNGPAKPRSAKLTASEEAMDYVPGHLFDYFPQLTRSALHRCLVRHGISQAANSAGAAKRDTFEKTERYYLHIDSSELRLETGEQQLFVAVDRVTKFTCAAFFDAATKRNDTEFLRQVVQVFPYKIHTVLTDNGAAFTDQAPYRNSATKFSGHMFDRVCYKHGIRHRLTKAYHPSTMSSA